MLSNKKVYIITTDNVDVLQSRPAIDSVWTDENKAKKRREELNTEYGDDVWYVEDYQISK